MQSSKINGFLMLGLVSLQLSASSFRRGYLYPLLLILVLDILVYFFAPRPLMHWGFKIVFVVCFALALHAKRSFPLPNLQVATPDRYYEITGRTFIILTVGAAFFFPGTEWAFDFASDAPSWKGVLFCAWMLHTFSILWTYDTLDLKFFIPPSQFFKKELK